jgi:two-component system chemotaxis response regulator CheB
MSVGRSTAEPEPPKRDVVVIGASMGGVEALKRLLGHLPPDLPASLFVVLHTADHEPGLLAKVLGSASCLPVVTAEEGQNFAPGNVYAAPPGHHLIVGHDQVHIRRGPGSTARGRRSIRSSVRPP